MKCEELIDKFTFSMVVVASFEYNNLAMTKIKRYKKSGKNKMIEAAKQPSKRKKALSLFYPKFAIAAFLFMSYFGIFYGFFIGKLIDNAGDGMISHTIEFVNSVYYIDPNTEVISLREKSAPLVVSSSNSFSTKYSIFTFDVTSDVPLTNQSSYDFEIRRLGYAAGMGGVVYSVTLKNLGEGDNKRSIAFKDNENQETKKEFTVYREKQNVLGVSTSNINIWLDGDDLLAIVDKNHALPSDYWPKDLVDLGENGIPITSGQRKLRKLLIPDLNQLISDAHEQGHTLIVLSAYRSYIKQIATFDMTVRTYGMDRALRQAALPGHSEHQLGTAIDFTSPDINWAYSTVENNSAFKWLSENAYKYGFVLSYPEGGEDKTGYIYEPWHYRYIGREHATAVQNSGKTLNEYLRVLHFGGYN